MDREMKQVLVAIKQSQMAESFGRHVDRVSRCERSPSSAADGVVVVIDLQTTNTPALGELAFDYLKNKYGHDKHFNDMIRLIGLRNRERFQGAISAYELLVHMAKGNYVFHSSGWGIGEILDVSLLREQLSVEFDYVPGRKDLSFETAFKTLIPVPEDHFLAMRLGQIFLSRSQENLELCACYDLNPKQARRSKMSIRLVILRWVAVVAGHVKSKDTKIESQRSQEPLP
jgi:transcription elongation factor GreA-like protein